MLTADVAAFCRFPASPSGSITEMSPIDDPLTAAVAVSMTIETVEVEDGFTVTNDKYSGLTPIHYTSVRTVAKHPRFQDGQLTCVVIF